MISATMAWRGYAFLLAETNFSQERLQIGSGSFSLATCSEEGSRADGLGRPSLRAFARSRQGCRPYGGRELESAKKEKGARLRRRPLQEKWQHDQAKSSARIGRRRMRFFVAA